MPLPRLIHRGPVTPEMTNAAAWGWSRMSDEKREVWREKAQRYATRTGEPMSAPGMYLADYINRKVQTAERRAEQSDGSS